jgi:hypothetical protein
MRTIITPAELTHRSNSELSALFRQVSQELTSTAPGSTEHRDALTNLENIRRAQATRSAQRPKSPGL